MDSRPRRWIHTTEARNWEHDRGSGLGGPGEIPASSGPSGMRVVVSHREIGGFNGAKAGEVRTSFWAFVHGLECEAAEPETCCAWLVEEGWPKHR